MRRKQAVPCSRARPRGRAPFRRAGRFLLAVFLFALLFLIPTLLRPTLPDPDPQVEARVVAALPPGLDDARRHFVLTACTLVGRVDYFWGGKSQALGWDKRWGKPALVTAADGPESGERIPFGLDCSGYVSWTVINAAGTAEAAQIAGDGVRAQYACCRPVASDEVQPGDLAFFPDLSHVGIVAGRTDDGALLILHCSHSLGGVVLSADGAAAGFTLFGTPDYYLVYGNRTI